ncbi:MAG TPA: hypothetical protein VGK38_11925, partial [Prolixibacteraceae bacterium]
MSYGLRLDKLLITNDMDYIPFGANAVYYNGSFEPPELVYVHDQNKKVADIEPKAIGWHANFPTRWAIMKDPVTANHFYFVSKDAKSVDLAYSLIKDLQCCFFSARFSILHFSELSNIDPDILFVFGFQDKNNYHAVRIHQNNIILFQMCSGEKKVIRTAHALLPKNKESTTIAINLQRNVLSMECENQKIFSARLPIPPRGLVGIGSIKGGVGFDDFEIHPRDDAKADFDFTVKTDPALHDWKLIRRAKEEDWKPETSLCQGDLLIYHAPRWSNSQLSLEFMESLVYPISILFPYADAQNYMQITFEGPCGREIKLLRRRNGQESNLGHARLPGDQNKLHTVTIQSIRGLLALFVDNVRVLEANEYDILEGTVGLLIQKNESRMPLKKVRIEEKKVITDNFSLIGQGELAPE